MSSRTINRRAWRRSAGLPDSAIDRRRRQHFATRLEDQERRRLAHGAGAACRLAGDCARERNDRDVESRKDLEVLDEDRGGLLLEGGTYQLWPQRQSVTITR